MLASSIEYAKYGTAIPLRLVPQYPVNWFRNTPCVTKYRDTLNVPRYPLMSDIVTGRPKKTVERFPSVQEELFSFVADAPFARLKNLEPFMGTAWFSLEKRPRKTPIRHEYENYWVEILPSTEGIATYWDQDVLLYVYSQLINGIKSGAKIGPVVNFTGPDFFRFVGQKWQGQKDYTALRASLRRLQGTVIRTNLKPTGTVEDAEKGEGWITKYQTYKEKGVGIFQVTVPQTFYDAVQDQTNWLTLDHSYFQIMGGLERFIYTWGRKATGFRRGNHWEESFDSLHEKSGSTATKKRFRYNLRQIISQQNIPGYTLEEREDIKRGTMLSLTRDPMDNLLLATKKIRKRTLPNKQINQLKLPI